MKIEKFEKFFESTNRVLTLQDLEDLCVSMQDSLEGFLRVNIFPFFETNNGWRETIDYLDFNDKIENIGLILQINYNEMPEAVDLAQEIKYLSEMYSELSDILKIVKSIYNISKIESKKSTENNFLQIYISLPKSEYYEKYFSEYLLENLLYNYDRLVSNIKNYRSGKDSFVEIQKQLDFIERKDFDKNIIEDQIYSQFGKRFVEFELEEKKNSYIFKNFKIKNLFK